MLHRAVLPEWFSLIGRTWLLRRARSPLQMSEKSVEPSQLSWPPNTSKTVQGPSRATVFNPAKRPHQAPEKKGDETTNPIVSPPECVCQFGASGQTSPMNKFDISPRRSDGMQSLRDAQVTWPPR